MAFPSREFDKKILDLKEQEGYSVAKERVMQSTGMSVYKAQGYLHTLPDRVAEGMTHDAQEAIAALENILAHTLSVNHAVNWETLKSYADYPIVKPENPNFEREPKLTDSEYQPSFSFMDKIFRSRKSEKLAATKRRFIEDSTSWKKAKEKFEAELAEWEQARDEYTQKRDKNNAVIEHKRTMYLDGDTETTLDYFDMVLSSSKYPDCFPKAYDLDYNVDGKLLIVDYQLPDPTSISSVREVKYIKARDEFKESYIPKTQLNKLYDNMLYQTAIRTVYEIFKADKTNKLTLVVFNGYVNSIDPATGQKGVACVLSLQANREEIEAINLADVEPKACFKHLKGISSSRLYSLTPIAPILRINREDSRFIDSYAVADGIGEEDNLAAMDWEDFEHLVREVFEKEFSSTGGEVKVTRASRDGGIDAVAFDPDPIRGGKFVIQAKRYTNTVGVSAVRDLYGSVINEGAIKGILVTTADYGPDAYEFAKDKPLTLLNGNNLLHILEKHGHKAKIDIREAKKILAVKNAEENS